MTRITDVQGADLWVNGGYFRFRQELFEFIREGEDLLEEPFRRLIQADELVTIATRGSRRRWTPSRTSSGSRAPRPRPTAVGA